MTNVLSVSANLKAILAVLFTLSALSTATVGVVHAQGPGDDGPPQVEVPDVAPPQIDDAISDAELRDLEAVANQFGISLQEAINRYAWNDNFALAVGRIRQAAPGAFTGAEIVDAHHAWVAFAGPAPQAALDLVDTFRSSYSGVSVEVRTDLGFTEVELQRAIEAVHYAVLEATGVRDASTSYDFATGQIETNVVMESSASASELDDLRDIAVTSLISATRSDILNSVSTSVVRSDRQTLGGDESDTEHLGGESLSSCTSGFGTKDSSGVRGISTAGHCPDSLTDDDLSLTFKDQHEGTHGDFQWHTGSGTETDDFYAGNSSSNEVDRRDVSSVECPTVGQTLCRNGKMSYRDCQEVRKLNVCSGGDCNLVQMGAHLSTDGDSGAPVYWNNTAYGIHKGWMHDPWPFKREVFSRADRIDDALDISIATD